MRAAVYDVGPGLNYTNLGSVPWTGLQPGDTVNVHYRAGGYHEVILLSRSGTANAPITLNGIPDPATGALPTLDGAGAVTATNVPWHNASLNTEGVIVVSPNANQPYPYYPQWITIQNLHVQDASPSNELTTTVGGTTTYDSAAAAIYVEYAQHLVVSGCELSDSCNGFFCDAENGDPNTTTADVTIQHCWVHDNGFPGDYEAHNLNTQSRGIVFQYNQIGPMTPSAAGDDLKDMSSGTILRYNLMIQNTGGWFFWFVQPDGGVGVIDQDPAYHTNYVYGNVFLNPPNGTLTMFAYDYLGQGTSPRNGTLYFYNNTVVNYADQSVRYFTDIFQLPTYADSTSLNIHDVVDCRNNIFAAMPVTANAAPSQAYLLGSDAGTIVLGTNWVSSGFATVQLPYGSTNFQGAITGTNQFIFGDGDHLDNPGFVSVGSTNFNLLSSSPAIDAAGPESSAVLASPNNVVAEYVYPTGGQSRIVNGLAMDLGAFEGISTNFTGPLFNLTVSNGFGSGAYPSNTLVLIAASNAAPNEVFAGWTGGAVANPSSAGTTFRMPASNLTVTATYSNLPDYTLDVENGTGGGSYLPGTVVNIGANPPPAGEVFANWTGFAVANASAASTTLVMPSAEVTVTATYSNAPVTSLFTLNVVNGTGSGSYVAGSTVYISANSAGTNETFSGWTGYAVANPAATSTSLVMPGEDVTVTATFQFSGPLPSKFPPPVTSHPRLWLTTNDLPKYRSWAVASNPVYPALQIAIQQAVSDYQEYFPGGVANPDYPDDGDSQGYTGLLTEDDAVILAFGSLIDPNPANRSLYAGYARNLLIYALSQAALGTLTNAPFRDPSFAIYNRSGYAEDWALAVDWIYSATDTNGQPILSPADKLTIRNGFLTWSSQCLTASTTGGDSPAPVGVLNSQQLLPNGAAYRMAANNYYLSHARFMTMMGLAIDPADDPPVNTNLSVSVLGNSMRSYLDDAIGAWMYQEYAMFGDASSVIPEYGLATNANVGLASGGMPVEGMLYGESIGSALMGLLALQTAGYNNPNLLGPQAALINSPIWGRYSSAMLSSLVPAAQVPADAPYMGPIFLTHNYGDLLRSWITPDGMIPFALQSLLERYNGVTNHYDAARWFLTEATEGGSALLTQRVWDWNYGVDEGFLYFMMLDPNLPPAPDPRPSLALAFRDVPFGHICDRTSWATNAAQFDFLANWLSINHQQGGAGQFEFYRNGEWLTKQLDNYDDNLNGQSSMWHNLVSLENWCSAGDPELGFDEPLFLNGSEYMLGESAGDPVTLTSSSPAYTYASADLTALFNAPAYYEPQDALQDIRQATRNIIWIKPDHIVVYDRDTSMHAGLFKRFNLNFITTPTVNGHTLTEATPGGQQLFVQTLLPVNATFNYTPVTNITTISQEEPTTGRIIIEDPNHPADERFLHVLQGADSNAVQDAVAYVASTGGNAFEGAIVRGVAVLFPVDALSNNFGSVTYSVPAGITNHYVAGLTPGGAYSASLSLSGESQRVTVTPGGGLYADVAGLLSFTSGGQTLSGAARLNSAAWTSTGLRFAGLGVANVTYSILTTTNLASGSWTTVGSTTADGNGNLEYTDSTSASGPQRFYRVSAP